LTVDASAVVTGQDDGTKWWTFAGEKANAALVPALANMTQIPTTSDSLSIDFDRPLPPEAAQQAIDELRSRGPSSLLPQVTPEAVEALKFSECLPSAHALQSLAIRRRDKAGLAQLLEMTIRFVSVQGANPG
jgi:ATP-dependent Lhr-like helicase